MSSTFIQKTGLQVLTVVMLLTACYHQDQTSMRISHTYIVIPAGAAPAVLYALLDNHTRYTDTLMTISTPAARVAELHQTVEIPASSSTTTMQPMHDHAMPGMSDTTMAGMAHMHSTNISMRPVPALPVPTATTVRFMPGGYHVMLIDPAQLHVGDSVDVTFTFAHVGRVTTRARVITYADVDTATGRMH